jgi:hypothetical protein
MAPRSVDDSYDTIEGYWYGGDESTLDLRTDSDGALTGTLQIGSQLHPVHGWSGKKGFVFTTRVGPHRFVAASGKIRSVDGPRLALTATTVTSDDRYWATSTNDSADYYRTVDKAREAGRKARREAEQRAAAKELLRPSAGELPATHSLGRPHTEEVRWDEAGSEGEAFVQEARVTPDRPPIKSPREKE